jgi:hypothetical protein
MTDDRRRTPRHARPEEHGILSARVRPGHDVSVVDVSAGGVLIETRHRLMPGTSVDLHLRNDEQTELVRGRVLRCAVARLRPNAVCYRGAIAFDRHLPWFVEDASGGYPVPDSKHRRCATKWAGVTPEVV